MNSIVERFNITPRTIFLVDGIGALLSAMLLLFVLAQFEAVFGMPQVVSQSLSIPAFIFAAYSLTCYVVNLSKPKYFLLVIAIANCLYCFATMWLLIQHRSEVTILGWAYFLGEIAIILTLARLEWILMTHSKNN